MYGRTTSPRPRASTAPPTRGPCRPRRGRVRRPRPCPTTLTTNAQGQQVSTGQLVRMAPIYQELRVPGQHAPVLQPAGRLRAGVRAEPDPDPVRLHDRRIGSGPLRQLQMFVTPREQPVNGPAIVAAQIDATPTVSKEITLLNTKVLRPAGQRADDPGGQLAAVHPAPLRGVVAQRRPRPPTGHRRVRPAGGDRQTLSGALSSVFKAPVSTATGNSGGDRRDSRPQVRGSARRCPGRLPAVPGRPEGRQPGRLPDRTSRPWSPIWQQVQQLTGGTVGNDDHLHHVDHQPLVRQDPAGGRPSLRRPASTRAGRRWTAPLRRW